MDSVNSVNQHMKNPPLNLGIIIPPDDHYKPVLYSDREASKAFNQLDYDIYQSVKKSEKANKKKTPKSVFWALGIAALALCIKPVRKLFKK